MWRKAFDEEKSKSKELELLYTKSLNVFSMFLLIFRSFKVKESRKQS